MLIMDKATKGSAGGPMGSSRVFGTNMRMGTHRTTGGKRGVSAANDRGPAPTSNTADFAGKIQSSKASCNLGWLTMTSISHLELHITGCKSLKLLRFGERILRATLYSTAFDLCACSGGLHALGLISIWLTKSIALVQTAGVICIKGQTSRIPLCIAMSHLISFGNLCASCLADYSC